MVGLIILSICAVAVAAVMIWNMLRLKREVYDLTDRLEKNLDNILSEKEMGSVADLEDTLWGKVSEKLLRVQRVWKRKEQESFDEKRMMKELISDISHQTKTPIANQKIYLEILRQEPMSQRGLEFLGNMEKQTDKLDFLLQSLVKMSRLETGIIKIHKKEADLVSTVGQAVAAVVPAAAKKQIQLSVECAKTILIPHDKKWTEEAIFNLLDNAVKYTDAGGSVKISILRQEIFTKISVKDSGKGIPLERQAQIFTRFYREPEVHGQEGIGIGLFLARKMIELQNGYVEVRSELGQGSDFLVYLPND